MHIQRTRRAIPAFVSLAAIAAAGQLAAAGGGATDVAAANKAGYPRCSKDPPVAIDSAGDGYGSPNVPGGTTYDTNWVLDGTAGDEDIVWFRVDAASIEGYGHAKDADIDSATHWAGSAWGEARVEFTVADADPSRCLIRVTNSIRISAAWNVQGTGRNHAYLSGEALDINGGVHPFQKMISAGASVAGEDVEEESSGVQAGNTFGAGGESGGTASTTQTHTGSDRTQETRRSEAVGDQTDSVVVPPIVVTRDFLGNSCEVQFASSETIDVQAQAMVDGVQTTSIVPKFHVVNVVSAAYVVDPGGSSGPGPGTPPGTDGDGPTTPGGGGGEGGGTGPVTPGGGTPGTPPVPSGGGGSGAPGAPSTPGGGSGGSAPITPGGSSPQEPVIPGQPERPADPAPVPPVLPPATGPGIVPGAASGGSGTGPTLGGSAPGGTEPGGATQGGTTPGTLGGGTSGGSGTGTAPVGGTSAGSSGSGGTSAGTSAGTSGGTAGGTGTAPATGGTGTGSTPGDGSVPASGGTGTSGVGGGTLPGAEEIPSGGRTDGQSGGTAGDGSSSSGGAPVVPSGGSSAGPVVPTR